MNYYIILLLFINNLSFIPGINDTITIHQWQYLGPFSMGMREGIIGVEENIRLLEDFEPDKRSIYPSLLVQGGKVTWQTIESANGIVEIEYENVLWDSIQDYYGAAGVLCGAYAYGDFSSGSTRRALVIAQDVSSFILNGVKFPGDPYSNGFLQVPVVLKKGKNRVIVKLSGFGDHEFTFKLIPVPGHLMLITKDITTPDFLRGEPACAWAGIPIVNATNQRLFDIQLKIEGVNIKTGIQTVANIMPFSAVKIPLNIESEAKIETEEDSILITITASFDTFSTQEDFWIKVKHRDEAYVKTFISRIDNSCQYYAILPPENYNEDSSYALIMTCHGAGVEARGQVKAYTQKDWAFVVASTNRRRFGFDWQDWGRLDFLEVLEDVKKKFKIDTNRIYLTGHSMGGHGAWHIGTTHPDIFAAMAPSAGWTSFQLYVPWFLQKSELFAHPDLIKYRDMVLREDNPLLFLENAYNLPIYLLQGGADDNVPPIQARMFCKYLTNLGYDYIYNEVEGKGHWWNIDSTPGTDCVDLKEMMDFLESKVRNPYPEHIVFKTSNIDHSNQAYWVRIDELEDIYYDGLIEIEHAGKKILENDRLWEQTDTCEIIVNETNVNTFTLFLDDNFISPGVVNLIINGQRITFEYREPCELSFKRNGDGFFWATRDHSEKSAGRYGPIKKAYFEPFVLVYGTTGDSVSTENNLHQARLQSYTWWYRANGFVEILPDTEITKKIIKNYNLVLFGNPVTNSILKWISYRLPLHIEEGRVIVDRDTIRGDICLVEIYPNPLNPEKFVLLYSATTKPAEKLIGLFSTLYAGAGLPDFLIYDKSALKYGWGGVKAAGFFDKNWKFNSKLSYIKK
jgi:predicted esterase